MKKIESIKELRKICQPEYEEVKNILLYRIYRRFFRIFSIYITRTLLSFNVSANLVSIFGLISGVIGSLFLYFGEFLIGSIILQLWLLVDTLDGEVARYYARKKPKNYLVKGEFLDLNFHHLIHFFVFLGLSLGLYNLTKDVKTIYLGMGALSALLLNELIDLNKIKLFFYYNIKFKKAGQKRGLLKKLMFIYTFPSIANLILIFSIFNKVDFVIYFYGITFPIMFLIKFYINNFIRKW